MFKLYSREDGLLDAYCATTNQKTQMEEERMLYITFCVNVDWHTLKKLGNGLCKSTDTSIANSRKES